jgi:hypothetical protein
VNANYHKFLNETSYFDTIHVETNLYYKYHYSTTDWFTCQTVINSSSATDLQVLDIVDCGCRAAFGSKSSLHHGLQVSGTTCQMITNCINKYIVYPVRVFCKKVVFTIYFVQCRLRHRCHFYRFISLCVVCWKATHELDSSRPNSS